MSSNPTYAANRSVTPAAQYPAVQSGSGFWARVIIGITTAREMQAKRETNRFLARQTDRFLRDIGLDEVEIAELRRQDTL